MRVGYVISSYQPAAQLNRLVRAISHTSTDPRFFLGHDQRVLAHPPGDLDAAFELVGLPDEGVGWGTWAFMHLQLAGVAAALDSGCDWLVTISGQDYPVQQAHRFERRLKDCEVDGFIEEFDHRANYQQLLERYRRRIITETGRTTLLLRPRLVRRVINRTRVLHVQDRARGQSPLLERAAAPPLAPYERLRMGNNWWALSAKAARALLDRRIRDPKLVDHFAATFIPSEAFPHTVLLNDPDLRFHTDQPLQHTRWDGWSPRMLSAEDVPEAIASGRPFARKFACDDPALDLLDEHLEAG